VRNCSFDWTKSNRRAAAVTGPTGGGMTDNTAHDDGRNEGDAAAPGRNLTASAGDPFGESLGRWIPNPDELGDCSQDGPETAVLRESEIEEVRAMIRRLPEPFRETLVLRELEELSYKQIAEVTGVPVGTVMSRLARARQMLSAELQEQTR
jgi:RNA polymerase sigma factor (sigma-70 family)